MGLTNSKNNTMSMVEIASLIHECWTT